MSGITESSSQQQKSIFDLRLTPLNSGNLEKPSDEPVSEDIKKIQERLDNSKNLGMKHNFINVSITKTKGRLEKQGADSSITQKIIEEVSGMEINFHSAREINHGKPVARVLTSGMMLGNSSYMNSSTEFKSNQNLKQVDYKAVGRVVNKNDETTFFETGIKLTGYKNTTSLKQYSEAMPLEIKDEDFKKEDAKDLEFLFDIKDDNAGFPESGVGYIKWIDDLKESLGGETSGIVQGENGEEVFSVGNYYENLFTSNFNSLEVSEDGSFTSYEVKFTYFSSYEQNNNVADSQKWLFA